jgi:hypothetical protein
LVGCDLDARAEMLLAPALNGTITEPAWRTTPSW